MMKKLVLASLLAWGIATVLNGAPIVRIDFPCENFWGQLTCLDELPEGVWIGERGTFHDKRRKGYTFPVFVDLAKATGFELTFTFKGRGMAKMAPALTGYADDGRKQMTELRVVEFSVDGDGSSQAPCIFRNWKSMTPFVAATDKELKKGSKVAAGQKYWQIWITNGKTIKVKAVFKTAR